MSKRIFLKASLIFYSMISLFFSGCIQKKSSLFHTKAKVAGDKGTLNGNVLPAENDFTDIKKQRFWINEKEDLYIDMIEIPGQNYALSSTEITQAVYEAVTGENPSENYNSTPLSPVDSVSWYDAVVFCNRLSLLLGLRPVYSVNGSVNPDEWEYEGHSGQSLTGGKVQWEKESEGFRLPSEEEWIKAAVSGKSSPDYNSSAGKKQSELTADELDSLAWYNKNSSSTPHEVSLKKQNLYGLYDIFGNVWEWVWDCFPGSSNYRIYKGGSCTSDKKLCSPYFQGHHYPSRYSMNYSYWWFGIRLAKNARE